MGQGQSGPIRRSLTTQQAAQELADKFARKCFEGLELYSFKDVFNSLADHKDGIAYIKEDTIARFLEIPDILGVSSILFQMVSYLGAFPFGSDAPVLLEYNQMIMVVVIMTERYKKVLQKGSTDRTRLLFRSLAVYDRGSPHADSKLPGGEENQKLASENTGAARSHAAGFAVDEPLEDPGDKDEDEDELAMAALEFLDNIEEFPHGDIPIAQSSIPTDNLRKLIMLLLLIAPLGKQESLSRHTDRLSGDLFEGLSKTADNILAAFMNIEKSTGAKFRQFNTVIPISLPFLFNGFNPLFEHFLFSKNLDFTKRKDSTSAPPPTDPLLDQPLLAHTAEILDLNVLSQLSFFIPPTSLFRSLHLLYSGGDAGFSMGQFETKVFNWRSPTILLVSGSRIFEPPSSGQEARYAESLPPKRFPDSSPSSRVVFGVYLSTPWRQTHKECIGGADTLLFQLEPVHEVFHASLQNTDYVTFAKAPSPHPGIAFGCQPSTHRASHLSAHINLGAVSLALDSSFEFGVFTHNFTSGGGAFRESATRRRDWQDRFEIESLEVWGCGGDKEAKAQQERWAWEAREAENRRRINLGTGDQEADRALLEMAGLVGANRSGGSMN